MSATPIGSAICADCGQPFVSIRRSARYCRSACRVAAFRNRRRPASPDLAALLVRAEWAFQLRAEGVIDAEEALLAIVAPGKELVTRSYGAVMAQD